MAFVAEDGTGLANSNSLVSVEFVNEYHSDRNNTDWDAADPENEAYCIKGTELILHLYQRRWPGDIVSSTQALAWPRKGGYDVEGTLIPYTSVPLAVKQMVAEAARIYAAGENPLENLARSGQVASFSVGPISESYFNSATGQTVYPIIRSKAHTIVLPGGIIRRA